MIRRPPRSTLFPYTDALPISLLAAIGAAEHATARNARLHLRLAVDYSSRWAIGAAALLPDVDLLIRTGGEQRLSRSEEHTSELQSQSNLVCRLLLEKKKEYTK